MYRATTPTPGSACPSSPQDSLFKFRLYFHELTDEYRSKNGQPWVWYSFDKPDERAMFPDGLPRDLRTIYGQLLYNSYRWPDLYNLLRECHPVWRTSQDGESELNLYMASHVLNHAQAISAKYEDTVEMLMHQAGVKHWRMNHKPNSRTVPGLSPMRKRSVDYYGLKRFRKNATVSAWFSTRKLKMVEVFDNRCYHVENLFCRIEQNEYPMPLTTGGVIKTTTPPLVASVPVTPPAQPTWQQPMPDVNTPPVSNVGRINKGTSIGSIIAHYPK
ncbi:hypothetical protein [Spirosoma pomorum]